MFTRGLVAFLCCNFEASTVTHHCHTLKNEWVPCGVLLGSVWPEIGGLMRARRGEGPPPKILMVVGTMV